MSRDAALLIDFGSTYTKLRAVDLDKAEILASGQGPSTVDTDITNGLDTALADLEAKLGGLPDFTHRLASSSAAGGLRMVTVGLVKELTAEAARQAALGAGAKLVGTFAYRLTQSDLDEIAALSPDMVLLAGGTDGGNSDVIRHNGAALADTDLACPFVIAGNRDATDDIAKLLEDRGKPVSKAGNVMPALGELDIEPARQAIRQIFIDRIVHAKGIDKAADRFDAVLMPTPAAVMEGARLLAEGTEAQSGLGPLLIVDIGGATTDVHSVASGDPTDGGVIRHGLPDPFVKRTVEGDLGLRINARSIVETAGLATIASHAGQDEAAINARLETIAADVETLSETSQEADFDAALAWVAVRIAVARHAGTTKVVQTVTGPVTVQEGKDLGNVDTVIGTGGILAYGVAPATILNAALADPAEPMSLRPKTPRLMIDADYMLYSAGLLGQVAPEVAFALAQKSLKQLQNEVSHEQRRLA